MNKLFVLFMGALVLAVSINSIPPQVRAASVSIDHLPPPQLVIQARQELLNKGCVEITPEGTEQTITIPDAAPVAIAAHDWQVGKFMFCSREVTSTLTAKSGKVLDAQGGQNAPPVGSIIISDPVFFAFDRCTFEVGLGDTINNFLNKACGSIFGIIAKILFGIFIMLLLISMNIFNLVLKLSSYLISLLFFIPTFTTHPFVIAAAGVLQSFINAAFILGFFIHCHSHVTRGG